MKDGGSVCAASTRCACPASCRLRHTLPTSGQWQPCSPRIDAALAPRCRGTHRQPAALPQRKVRNAPWPMREAAAQLPGQARTQRCSSSRPPHTHATLPRCAAGGVVGNAFLLLTWRTAAERGAPRRARSLSRSPFARFRGREGCRKHSSAATDGMRAVSRHTFAGRCRPSRGRLLRLLCLTQADLGAGACSSPRSCPCRPGVISPAGVALQFAVQLC
jgi:hypothetical protein